MCKSIVKQWSPTTKCNKCNIVKDTREDFGVRKDKRKDKVFISRRKYCKACDVARTTSSYYNNMKARADKMVNTSYHRSLKKEIPFDLTTEWLLPKLEAGVCEATGISLALDEGKGKNRVRSFTASLDRTDNTKGYTMDNVKVVCWIYNSAKGVGTHDDVMKLARALTNV